MNLVYSAVSGIFDKIKHLVPLPIPFGQATWQGEDHEKPINFHDALRQTLQAKDYKGTVLETHPMSDEFQRRDSKLDSPVDSLVKKESEVGYYFW
jgi:hypothetical protein